jgi:hypothetical protein
VTLDATAVPSEPVSAESGAAPSERIEELVGSIALSLLPGALIVYFSFEAGGYFPGSTGFVALLVSQLLVLRVLLTERPLAGSTGRQGAVAVAFAAYTAWTLASALWSHALNRALVEFDRALLYLLLLLLFGVVRRTAWRMALMLWGLAAGSLVICTVALITRTLPHVWPIAPGVANNRLSYPLTYWNALGLLAALSILFLVGVTSRPRERRVVQAIAAAGVPIAASTLLLTFSRGGIAALIFGALVFLVIGRSSALPGALLAVLPATAVAVIFTYDANLLATLHPTTPGAVSQGHRVAIAVACSALGAAVLRLVTTRLDRRLVSMAPRVKVSPAARWTAGAGALAAAVAVAVAAGAPGWISHQFHIFVRGAPVNTADLRTRLTDPSSNNRTDNWRAGLKGFSRADAALGTGAGTYEFSWYRYRRNKGFNTVQTHSLYVQALTELGVVGLTLLVAALVGLVVALARRTRGPDKVIYAALLSAVLAWALHAGIDWDWQMPAVTAWVFAVGGAAMATSRPRSGGPMALSVRAPVVAALFAAAVLPVLFMLSQNHLDSAAAAFQHGNCAQAESQARSSINVLSMRPQPHQILGYCYIGDDRPQDAIAEMNKAVQEERDNWQYHYSLSIAQGFAGEDPRRELRTAIRLDPEDPLLQDMVRVLRTSSPSVWSSIAEQAYFLTIGGGAPRLTLR